jgi:hypothetical protein
VKLLLKHFHRAMRVEHFAAARDPRWAPNDAWDDPHSALTDF